ncbi:MAG: hypothetical protein H6Q45_288 [Deltaproteobacteria bacterium]|jgi:hypothetical protein|nr:hypothetical protein [Deltaproteobacteria bacterium]
MNLELSKEDLLLIKALLDKEHGVIGVQIHHCRTHDFKDLLKQSARQIESILERVKKALDA